MEGKSRYVELDSPSVRSVLAACLANQDPERPSANIFREHNLIGRMERDVGWSCPVGHFCGPQFHAEGAKGMHFHVPKAVSYPQHSSENDRNIRTIPVKDLREIRTPPAPLPCKGYVKLVPSRYIRHPISDMRRWLDFQVSCRMRVIATGVFGYWGDPYAEEAVAATSETLEVQGANSQRHLSLSGEESGLRHPSRIFATWQGDKSDPLSIPNPDLASATNTSHRLNASHIEEWCGHLKDQPEFRICRFRDPQSGSEEECYVMIAPPGVISELKHSVQPSGLTGQTPIWWDYRTEETLRCSETGIVTGAIGKVGDMVLIEDCYLPWYRNEAGVRIDRCIILGSQAIAYRHKLMRCPVSLRDPHGKLIEKQLEASHECWAHSIEDGHRLALSASTTLEIAIPTCKIPGSGAEITKGLAVADVVCSHLQSVKMA